MKTIYIIRHAKSSWSNPELSDHQRPLNNRGKRDAPFMAKVLKAKGVKPDAIVTSPAVRALTTAMIFAQELEVPEAQIIRQPKIYEAFTADITNLIQNLNPDWTTVLLFGHNPTLTSVVNLFEGSYLDNLPTTGIVRIDAEVTDWKDFNETNGRQSEYHYPKQYFN